MPEYDVQSGVTSTGMILNLDEFMTVYSGGTAVNTTVNSGGILNVSSGGMVIDTTANYHAMVYVSGGGVKGLTVNEEGAVLIGFDAVATNVVIQSGGILFEKGGSAFQYSSGNLVRSNLVMSGGLLYISGGLVEGAVISKGDIEITRGGRLAEATLTNAYVEVHANASIAGLTIADGATMSVTSGCDAQNIRVNSGGILTGSLGNISNLKFDGGTLELDIQRLSPGNDFLVDGYTFGGIDPNDAYTVTLKVQEQPIYSADSTRVLGDYGTYQLIKDAGLYGFNRTITVVNPIQEKLGTISLADGTKTIGNYDFTLTLDNGDLCVTLAQASPIPPSPTPGNLFFAGDFNGNLFDTLAVQKGSTVTVYQNGEPWGLGVTLESGWDVVGTGDFNGDHLDDFLRVNGDGYVVGEMSNGNGTFSPQVLNLKSAGWDILGTGDFNGNGTADVLIANPTGASSEVGLLGYWESGVSWTLINGYSAEWECVSTGDFNGDGKCDMLWRNSFVGDGGLTYNAYCTWIVEDPVDWRMVSVANPAEWDFLCSGDFDGNGSHDIAMINDVGVVGIWGVTDGYLSSWSILSAVTNEWQLAGVADFNADGTDDIAWSNTDTGLTGYWQINNKELTTWANIATVG